jgi:UDP-N-acetylmuramate dehydrogenase
MSAKRDIEKGQLQTDVNLAGFNTWQVGGNAERFYWPLDLEDLQQFLKKTPVDEKITWLGIGSNVLIPDEGIKGTVIVTQGALKELELLESNLIYAQAGISCAQVARFGARNNLVNGEFLAGIPGSIGGALWMNAGAFGGETWQRVAYVDTINHQGEVKRRYPAEFKVQYRKTEGLAPNEWFVAGAFKFDPGNGEESLAKIKALLDKRAQTQPTGEPSCGSTFKNPPGDFAGRLIESLDLKGHQIGQARISPKHANFIINMGGATAKDMKDMIAFIQQKVKTAYGIDLHAEVQFL